MTLTQSVPAPVAHSEDLVLTGVTKSYVAARGATAAVDQVSLTVPAGTAAAVRGASGSGKSTLLHLVAGIEPTDAGRIQLGDVEVTGLNGRELSRYRQRVGMVFQRFALLPALSALDNVMLPLLATGGRRRDRSGRARSALRRVGMDAHAGALPSELSGGEQQRVAVARAIVAKPALLLADEPTGNLDSGNARMVMDLLREVGTAAGTTLVVATHDDEVAGRCDRVVRLRDGQVVEGQ